jgi:NADH-quinone oxidoreductase subunit M
MVYDRAHTRNMEELGGMMKVLPIPMVAFIIGGLVSMGMPGLSGFVAELPILMGVWNGSAVDLSTTAFGLNPGSYYSWIAVIAILGVVITAAYILRAIGRVFFGEYDEHRWHDMRPLLSIDKVALVGFVAILVIIGVFPSVISDIVTSGVTPVVERVQEAQQLHTATTVIDTVQTAASGLVQWLGGV